MRGFAASLFFYVANIIVVHSLSPRAPLSLLLCLCSILMRKCACHILFLYIFSLHTHHPCRSRTAEDIFLQLSALSACCDFILCSTFFFVLLHSGAERDFSMAEDVLGFIAMRNKTQEKEPRKSFRRRREKFTTSHNDRFFIQLRFFSQSL